MIQFVPPDPKQHTPKGAVGSDLPSQSNVPVHMTPPGAPMRAPAQAPAANPEPQAPPADKPLPSPQVVFEKLCKHVIGQDEVKKTLSVGVFNHYLRLQHHAAKMKPKRPEVLLSNSLNPQEEHKDDTPTVVVDKTNVMVLGPTGSGKTLMARTLASILDVPLAIADATSLTEAGYVGDNVETILQKLFQAALGDISQAERGIVYIDEIDKLAHSIGSSERDVSGKGVQQSLLKIVEGAKVLARCWCGYYSDVTFGGRSMCR